MANKVWVVQAVNGEILGVYGDEKLAFGAEFGQMTWIVKGPFPVREVKKAGLGCKLHKIPHRMCPACGD